MKKTLVLGGPGAGKTTRLLSVVEHALDRGVAPKDIAFVSFTNAAADEARDRAVERFGLHKSDFPYFRTLHSLSYKELGMHQHDVFGKEDIDELAELTGELCDPNWDSTGGPAMGASADPLFTIDQYARTTRKTLREAWEDHGGKVEWFRLKRFVDAYTIFRRDRELLDFTDMLSHYVESPQGPVPVKVAIIDEVQDLTLLQWAVADKAFAAAEEIWAGGDDDQCQPAGTMVETNKGYKPIETLDPKRDRLVAFNRRDAALRFNAKFKKASSLYRGKLYSITAEGRKTSCTANHKWYVKWTEKTKYSKACCVYLMRKDNDFRVGWCQLFRVDGCFHLNVRANLEGADAVWVLKIFDNKRSAYSYEQIINARYGIPMLPFRAPARQNVTPALIASVFSAIDSRTGALRAIADHDLLQEYPFINRKRKNYSRYGATINEMVACNMFIFDGFITVPVREGSRNYSWKEAHITRSDPTKAIRVYSLDVQQHETYVADGLITHNSLYGWAGAAQEHLLTLPYEHEILPLSHRLPSRIFDFSHKIVKQIGRRYEKDTQSAKRQGEVNWVMSPEEMDFSKGSWLLLARTHSQTKPLEAAARAQGVVYSIKGKPSSVAPKHLRAILAYTTLQRGGRIEGADAMLVYLAMGLKSDKVNIDEKKTYDAAELMLVAKVDWHDSLIRIPLDDREYYRICLRRGAKLTEKPRIRISTIHGAKGAEAEHVLLSTDMNYRVQKGYEMEPDQEHRVWYVGTTRASVSLNLIAPTSVYGYRM